MLAWYGGRPPALPAPTGDALLELMGLAVGEPVPPEYEPMLAEDMGFRAARAGAPGAADRASAWSSSAPGVSGMLAAIRLHEAGIDHVVLEKNDDVGGTWLENAYPGAGVDTPSHLYSYSFAPRQWSPTSASATRCSATCATSPTTHDLRERIRFGAEVASAGWDAARQRWTRRAPPAGETRHRATP